MSDTKALAPARGTSHEVDLSQSALPTHAVRNDFVHAEMPNHLGQSPRGAAEEIALIHLGAVRRGALEFIAASGVSTAALKAIDAPSQKNDEQAFAA